MRDPKKTDNVNLDQEAIDTFCEELAQSLQDDKDDEGYFYQSDPDMASVGKPVEPLI